MIVTNGLNILTRGGLPKSTGLVMLGTSTGEGVTSLYDIAGCGARAAGFNGTTLTVGRF